MHTLYDILKVAPDAPAEVIRAAYRALSQRHHPDRNPGDASAVPAMQALNDAYAVLSDPQRRGTYDAWLRTRTGSARATVRGARPDPTPDAVPAAAPPRAVAASAGRERAGRFAAVHRFWWLPLLLAVAGVLAGSLVAHRPDLPPMASGPDAAAGAAAGAPAWEMRGLDTPPTPRRRDASSAIRPRAVKLPAPASAPALPATAAPVAPPVGQSAAAFAPSPGLPIVADPNGRPWPLAAGYVDGMPQAGFDGAGSVGVDNRGNAWPVFATLVALDPEDAGAVRHVYVPAMQTFRIADLRSGRYELHVRNLVTGEQGRSVEFTLRRDAARDSGVDVRLYPMPGDPPGALFPAAGRF